MEGEIQPRMNNVDQVKRHSL